MRKKSARGGKATTKRGTKQDAKRRGKAYATAHADHWFARVAKSTAQSSRTKRLMES